MFLLANRNILLRDAGGGTYLLKKGFIGNVPEQFCSGAYFDALVSCGKIAIPESTRDKSVQNAEEIGNSSMEKEIKRTRTTRKKA